MWSHLTCLGLHLGKLERLGRGWPNNPVDLLHVHSTLPPDAVSTSMRAGHIFDDQATRITRYPSAYTLVCSTVLTLRPNKSSSLLLSIRFQRPVSHHPQLAATRFTCSISTTRRSSMQIVVITVFSELSMRVSRYGFRVEAVNRAC